VSASDPTANLLGALALAVTDRASAVAAAAAGQGVSAVAAISALDQFLDRPTIDQLRRVLDLTPSGAVRLVDRLADAGLVTRGSGQDGRSRSVALTRKGKRLAGQLAAARAEALKGALAALSPAEQRTLHALMGRVMASIVHSKDGGPWICRLCDLAACGRDAGLCPTANAAAERVW
jgi:DNA-binding MarR family transcriptional regulator